MKLPQNRSKPLRVLTHNQKPSNQPAKQQKQELASYFLAKYFFLKANASAL